MPSASSSPRLAPRKSRTTGEPAAPKAFSPPENVNHQYRKEYNLVVNSLPECDLDLETAVVSIHSTIQRVGNDRKHERLQLLSAQDAHGRSVTWIELITGQPSFAQRAATIETPAKSKGKAKSKQRVEASDDDVEEHVLPATDDDLYAEVAPPRTPRKSQPSSSSSRTVVTNPRKQDSSSPLVKNGSKARASSGTPGEEPAKAEDPEVEDLAERLSQTMRPNRRRQRDSTVRASPRLDKIRRGFNEASPYVPKRQ
ncbi:hypothetical protein JCM9279_003713 [Rhodotorula babjevae]